MPSSPLLLLQSGRAPPTCFLISPAPLLCPQDPYGLEGALEEGYRLVSSAGSRIRAGQTITLCSSPTFSGESLPPAFPDLPGLRGTNPVGPPLLLSPQSPYMLPVHFGVPPISLGVRVPHQRLAGTPVVGRH